MKFSELARLAGEAAEALPHPESFGSYMLAAKTEVGEAAQALKGEWAWWRRDGRGFESNLDEAVGELSDVLLFLLSGFWSSLDPQNVVDALGSQSRIDAYDRMWEAAWTAHYEGGVDEYLWGLYITPDPAQMIAYVCQLCQILGITRVRLEGAIVMKNGVNKERWKEVNDGSEVRHAG